MSGLIFSSSSAWRSSCAVLVLAVVAVATAACTSSGPSDGRSGGASTLAPSGTGAAPSGPSGTSRSSSTTLPEPATTTVAPSSKGDLNSTVPTRRVRTAAPVPLRSSAQFGGSVTARLTQVERVRGKGRIPGEVSGPALSVTLTITNGGRRTLRTGDVLVDATDARRQPMAPLGTSSKPMRTTVAPGASASGTYVFTLPDGFTDPVTVAASYSIDAPVLRFVGTV